MRRVKSRPRLFSWDQFDATARTIDPILDGSGGTAHHDNDCNHHYENQDEFSSSSSSIAAIYPTNDNENDEDLEYMSCLSQSLHSRGQRYSSNSISNSHSTISYSACPSRSSSMLSLKTFSAHGNLDDEQEEQGGRSIIASINSSSTCLKDFCSSPNHTTAATVNVSGVNTTNYGGGIQGDEYTLLLDTDTAMDRYNRHGTEMSLPVVQQQDEQYSQRANLVSPPGTPRVCHSSSFFVDYNNGDNDDDDDDDNNHDSDNMRFLDFDTVGHLNKKRSLDELEQAVLYPRSLNPDYRIVSGATTTPTTTTTKSGTNMAPFNLLSALHQDVLIDCLEYLSLNDLKSLSVTCFGFYHLLSFGTDAVQKRRNHQGNTNKGTIQENDKHENNSKKQDDTDAKTDTMCCGIRNVLWWNWMKRQWPDLVLSSLSSSVATTVTGETTMWKPSNVQFVNRKLDQDGGVMNYIALLSQSQSSPTCIAFKYFEERPATAAAAAGVRARTAPEPSRSPLFRSFYSNSNNNINSNVQDGVQIVKFIGDVGVGDRSICTNRPFPRPWNNDKRLNNTTTRQLKHHPYSMDAVVGLSSFSPSSSSPIAGLHGLPQHIHNLIQEQRELASNSHRSNRLNIFERLRGCNMYNHSVGAVIQGKQSHLDRKLDSEPQPFVSPYVSSMTLFGVEIDLTPRMMAYFEVSILRKDDLKLNGDGVDSVDAAGWANYGMAPRPRVVRANDRNGQPNNQNEVHSACVAVGLSTQGFYDSSRMPGWDSSSYGYHGDDGGIFHSHGEMIRVYGPTYNVGDTVGCGVNYLNGGIFYTLNGNFLGYAWVNEKIVMDGKVDLYPTVGLDSADPIACNFGNRRPFVFNFAGFVANDGNMPISSGPSGGDR